MQNQLESIVQPMSGSRNVREGVFGGVKVIVVAGFDIWTDAWPFHVYLQSGDEPRSRLSAMPTRWRSASLEGAFEEGARLAIEHLMPRVAGARIDAPLPAGQPGADSRSKRPRPPAAKSKAQPKSKAVAPARAKAGAAARNKTTRPPARPRSGSS